jgi:N utilization substance protein B|tara:strand:+ start:1717 stop:2166 length:450 start_codon:yes stop_codon:yes gene_type:complete
VKAARRHDRRHQSREAALQVLYQSEIGKMPVDTALEAFAELESAPPQREFAAWLARGTAAHLDEIDPLITGSAQHWRLARMAVIDRLIMRLAVFEFLYAEETPRPVVINEALELARTFSADEAVAFVNGVLDDIRQRLDAGEAKQSAAD